MHPEFQIAVAILMFAGAFLQSIIGFGMGVFTIPVLVWLGAPLETAIGINLPSVFVQTTLNCWQNREQLPWKEARTAFILRIASLPVGIWLLRSFLSDHQDQMRQILGGVILAIVVAQLAFRPRQTQRLSNPNWIYPVGLLSGFLAGLIGMGGPPLVLWVVHQNWPNRKQRVFLWLSFLTVAPIHCLMMVSLFGSSMVRTLGIGFAVIPMILAGAWLGNRAGNRLSPEHLRFLMYAFLLIIAIRLLLSPWI